jgi:DNA repair exonuclease SbcCD ATPase subunit
MRYPTIEIVKEIEKVGESREAELVFNIVAECIEYIYDGDEIYYTKEQTKEELKEFIENLTQEQFEKIEKFFETMPKLKQAVSYKCPVCGKEHNKVLEGLNNFF